MLKIIGLSDNLALSMFYGNYHRCTLKQSLHLMHGQKPVFHGSVQSLRRLYLKTSAGRDPARKLCRKYLSHLLRCGKQR